MSSAASPQPDSALVGPAFETSTPTPTKSYVTLMPGLSRALDISIDNYKDGLAKTPSDAFNSHSLLTSDQFLQLLVSHPHTRKPITEFLRLAGLPHEIEHIGIGSQSKLIVIQFRHPEDSPHINHAAKLLLVFLTLAAYRLVIHDKWSIKRNTITSVLLPKFREYGIIGPEMSDAQAEITHLLPAADTFDEFVNAIEAVQEPEISLDGFLGAMALLIDQQRDLEARQQELVETARANGISWSAIGQSLGVTRQAAYKRFDPKGRENVRRNNDGQKQRRIAAQNQSDE